MISLCKEEAASLDYNLKPSDYGDNEQYITLGPVAQVVKRKVIGLFWFSFILSHSSSTPVLLPSPPTDDFCL